MYKTLNKEDNLHYLQHPNTKLSQKNKTLSKKFLATHLLKIDDNTNRTANAFGVKFMLNRRQRRVPSMIKSKFKSFQGLNVIFLWYPQRHNSNHHSEAKSEYRMRHMEIEAYSQSKEKLICFDTRYFMSPSTIPGRRMFQRQALVSLL